MFRILAKQKQRNILNEYQESLNDRFCGKSNSVVTYKVSGSNLQMSSYLQMILALNFWKDNSMVQVFLCKVIIICLANEKVK